MQASPDLPGDKGDGCLEDLIRENADARRRSDEQGQGRCRDADEIVDLVLQRADRRCKRQDEECESEQEEGNLGEHSQAHDRRRRDTRGQDAEIKHEREIKKHRSR